MIARVLAQTRAFEGSLGVDVLEDVAAPGHYVFIERWRSQADDNAYRAWRATDEGASGLGALISSPPVMTVFEPRSAI